MSDSEKKKFRIFYEVAIIIILILLLLLLLFRPKDNELVIPSTNDSEMITDNPNDAKVTPDDIQDEQKDTNISPVSDLLRPAGQPFVPTSSTAPAPTPTPEPVDPEPTPEVTRFSVTLSTNTYGVIKDSSEKTTTILVEEGKTIEAANKGIKIGGETYISALPDDNEYAYSAFVYNNTCGNTVTSDCEVEYKYDRTLKSYSVNFGINNPDNADLNFSLFTDRVKTYTIPVPYGTESELTDDNVIRFFGRGLDFYVQTELMLNTVEYTYDFAGIVENTCGTTITKECTVIFGASRTLNEYSVTFMMAEVGNDVYYTEQKKYGETFNIDELDVPVRDGYIFLGWIDADDNVATGIVTIDSKMQYRATWRERHSLLTISSMQEMTPLVIEDSFENETNQLIDTRDNKLYWVTKLKDGNVWMTQNLDYDIKATNNIVVKNDGTTSKWSPNTPTVTEVYQSRDNLGTNSYDPGNIAYMGTEGTEKDGVICNISENSGEDCHYHVGNYYQWNTATAGTGGAISDIEAQGSICPKGWRLPSNIESSGYSFGMLTKLYGITDGVEGSGEQAQGLLVAPFYYVYGGLIADSMELSNNGDDNYHEGYYWTASNSWNNTAYSDYYDYGDWWGVYGPDSGDRFYGLSVRCVANKVEAPEEPEPAVLVMQDVADWKDEIEVEEQIQAVDERDGKLYWVAKLKDGNIWMTQNLDYDIVAGDNIVSNNDGTTSIWNSSSAYAPTETATQLVAATRSLTGTYSYDNGDKGYINGASTETTGINCNTTSNSGEDCHYHMGNFYQWNAATAGTGGTITGQDAPSSICPKGWRLPIGNSYTADKSFGKLTNAYGITADNNATTDAAFIASPLYFLRGGGIDNRGNIVSLSSPSDLSSYWSSTATDTTDRTYRVYIMKDGLVSPTARYTRDHSFFVRCVANVVETPEPVARTMQNVADWKDELEEEEQVQVPDERDGKLYWVAKLKDGNVWMTQNLDYDIKPEDNIVAKLDGTTTTWSPNVTTSPTVYYDTTATGKQSYDPGNKYMPNGTGNFVDIVCDSSNMGDENCHYHVGNYYQWNAATAETGKDTKYDDDATLSICPAGWRLPSNNSYTNEYTIGKLTNAYGITNDKSGSSDANMLISPLYFNRPGYVYYGSVYNFKDRGFYWAGMAMDTPNATVETAYNLSIKSNLVLPDGNQGRDRGVNVRCVAI